MSTTLAALKLALCGSANTLTGVSISNADPSVLTKVSEASSIDDALSVGDVVTINSGTNATAGKYIAESIISGVSVTLDRQAATGACTDGNITYPAAQGVLQDSSYTSAITGRINSAISEISGGIRLPDGQISPPSPLLYDTDTVSTATDAPYKALPSDYQRGLLLVADENGYQIRGPQGGDLYSFALFLNQATKKDLSQAGSVSVVCVQGDRLYYQSIPSASYDLTIHFYRMPVDLVDDSDVIDAFPDNLATRLIQHYVAKEIFGQIEDGDDNQGVGYKYHTSRFYEAMQDYVDWAGIDEIPQYYSDGGFQDLGVCD